VVEANEWLTVQEAADRLKVSRVTIYRWAREGRLTIYKFSPKVARVRWQDIEALAQAAKGDQKELSGVP
jgi:excisionase family DNA binding protein